MEHAADNRPKKVVNLLFRCVLLLLAAIALLNLGIAAFFYFRTSAKLEKSIRVKAIVIRFTLEDGCYYPRVTFSDPSGKRMVLDSNYGRSMSRQERRDMLGSEIPIYYREGDSCFNEDSFLAKWMLSVIFVIQAAGVLFLMLILFIFKKIISAVIRALCPSNGESST